GIRDFHVTGVQTCALPISLPALDPPASTALEPHRRPAFRQSRNSLDGQPSTARRTGPPGAPNSSANPRPCRAPKPLSGLPHPPGRRRARPPPRPLPYCFPLLKFLWPILFITSIGGLSVPH